MAYALGYDYGTLSARALLVNMETGEEAASSVYEYPHGVMDDKLPTGETLPPLWALQHPQDYLDALYHTTHEILKQSNVNPESIAGIGIDFTSCTMLPAKKSGMPLCMLPEFENEKHAYVKLWKHHAAQYCADRINKLAAQRKEPWLGRYGGKISSEWMIPKILQIFCEAPGIYNEADRMIEAGDWLTWQLTGKEVRSACNAGYKAMWQPDLGGYPDEDFFQALNPAMRHVVAEKLCAKLLPAGSCVGGLTAAMAKKLGLCEGTPVSAEIIDAHASVPACQICEPGQMLMIMGTSTCHIVLSEEGNEIPGVCGVVKGGIIPGLYAYEAGQSCVGDLFSWFVENCVPAGYVQEAKERGLHIHALLCEKAESRRGLKNRPVALDWWNGVRSPLMISNMTGVIAGFTLQTKPEDLYLALIEATAFSTKKILSTFEEAGITIEHLYATGGIANKNPMAMQIYADVLNRPISIAASTQSGACGAAIMGALAANEKLCQKSNLKETLSSMGKRPEKNYCPEANYTELYNGLYEKYQLLYTQFAGDV